MDDAPRLEIAIDEGLCMGAGECVYHAPGTFAFDERGRSHVVAVDGDHEDVVVRAAMSCPNFAISVTRDGVRLV
jgi:ferredoxin